jgi:hypothetical protein
MAVLVLSGCSSDIGRKITPDGSDRLLALVPSSLGRDLALSQILTASYDTKRYVMQIEIDVRGDNLAVVGVSELGITLFKIVQTGHLVHVERYGLNHAPFSPDYMLSDIYLTYWPEEMVAAAYRSMGMSMKVDAGSHTRRVLDSRGALVALVEYSPDVIVIRHYKYPYEIRIRPLERRTMR